MKNITKINYSLCEDCTMGFFYNDFSGVEEDAVESVKAGLDREFGVETFIGLDSVDKDPEFCFCDCCGSRGNVSSFVAAFGG